MEKRMLGKTGIEVSRLCFGSLTMGPVQADLPLEEGAEALAEAFRAGVNFVDTAQLYKTYGYIKRAMDISGKRDIVISSKAYVVTYDEARDAVEEAMRELDRDVIDIFMLHEQESIHTFRGHSAALECLYDYKAKGKIRAVGASMHMVSGVRGATEVGVDVVHPLINKAGIRISDGTTQDMLNAIKDAHDAGIGTFAMKPLGGGSLIADPIDAFDFVLKNDDLDSIAVGMRSVAEVQVNTRIFEGRGIPDELWSNIRKKPHELWIGFRCVGCGACLEICSQGALYLEDGKVHVDRQKCLLCGYCATQCPKFAIRVV